MTKQMANKVKKTLKSEGIKHQTYFKDETLKVILIYGCIGKDYNEQFKEEIISVLRVLSKNGLRPEYEKAITRRTDAIWTYDQYSIIFK